MPDGRVAPDGTWRTGLSVLRPYEAIWTNVTVLPWLETSGRYTRFLHVLSSFEGGRYGDDKDKSFDLKLRVFDEQDWRPSVSFGTQDFQGTQLFRAHYLAASKRWGPLDATLGYGTVRLDGAFGGLRYRPESLPGWAVVAEYDAYDYRRDHAAEISGAATFRKGPAFALERTGTGYGLQLGRSHGETTLNAYLSVPLGEKELVPKYQEPGPYTKINPRPSAAQWEADPAHRLRLARALAAQDFRVIRIAYGGERLSLALTNTRISDLPRAVGRAARTTLSFAPLETREIAVTYETGSLPIATYTFTDAARLRRYFNGMMTRADLAPTVTISYPMPGATESAGEDLDRALAAFDEPLPEAIVRAPHDPSFVFFSLDDGAQRFTVRPGLYTFFNDPSGAIKFDFVALPVYERSLGRGLALSAEARLTLWENVSDVTQPSNSLLPHVRSDVAEYKRAARAKLNRLLVNRYLHADERTYVRLSGGIYEEMYAGVGGQALYAPAGAAWSADLAVDALRQREFEGRFGMRDYRTVTSIASFNYRMAHGVTASLRAGRFLAKDEGVRGELKRRFASGFQIGGWYTRTNGNDTTGPGRPGEPYYDKGIFMLIPLDSMVPYDTQTTALASLAPWTRDVGQMVASPGDLARLLEKPLVYDMHERDGLVMLGDREDDYDLPRLGTGPRERRWPDFVADDLSGMRASALEKSAWGAVAVAGLVTLGSSALDTRFDRAAQRYEGSQRFKNAVKYGDALPVAMMAASAVAAFDDSRPQLSNMGLAALEAGAVAAVFTEGIKRGVGRARPTTGFGNSEFDSFSSKDEYQSFPSRHSAVMWAAVTPYAIEYRQPWLYGLAAATNLARIGSREHWASDTVGGAFLGYALGSLAWDARRGVRKNGPRVVVGPNTVGVAWETP